MRTVGAREFRDQATTMMGSGETYVIERHGKPIGFFVPIVDKDRRAGRRVLGRLGLVVQDLMEHSGFSEDELVREVTSARRSR